jgi:hypothetical protein
VGLKGKNMEITIKTTGSFTIRHSIKPPGRQMESMQKEYKRVSSRLNKTDNIDTGISEDMKAIIGLFLYRSFQRSGYFNNNIDFM